MLIPVKTALASFWRAFFVLSLHATVAIAAPPTNTPPDLAQVGLPDPAEAQELLRNFRKADVEGQYFLEIELHALPRRGDEKVFHGRLWGGRNENGAIVRVELVDAAGAVRRLLVQNGERAAVWLFANGRVDQLGVNALFEPVIPGVEITAFDIQRPFLYWPDATLEKIARVLGRPAHAFLFRAPAAFVTQHPEITAARAYLDTQFASALMQTELLGPKGDVLKTMSLVGVKKIGDQAIPQAIEWRNEVTRDKTRLTVVGAALDQIFRPTFFDPAKLTESIPPPAADRITHIAP